MDFEISPGQFKTLQKSGEAFTLLDVREPWEYEASRIEGAKHIPMADIPPRSSGTRSRRPHRGSVPSRRAFLNRDQLAPPAGYEKAQSMRGGIDGWARTVDPKVPLY